MTGEYEKATSEQTNNKTHVTHVSTAEIPPKQKHCNFH